MNRPILLAYQWLIAISDTATGALLIVTPEFTLTLMGLHVPSDALPYVSLIGAFVLSVGLACIFGALVMARRGSRRTIEMVWLLTAFTRASVAIIVVAQVMNHSLESGWITVAAFDGACVLIQAIGLRRCWLAHVAR